MKDTFVSNTYYLSIRAVALKVLFPLVKYFEQVPQLKKHFNLGHLLRHQLGILCPKRQNMNVNTQSIIYGITGIDYCRLQMINDFDYLDDNISTISIDDKMSTRICLYCNLKDVEDYNRTK